MNTSKHNLPLLAGLAIVVLMLALAFFGPALAPRDPLERTLIAEIGGRTRGTPFPPFQSWEWPLGSDRFGRDLFSRLLHGVRPTLILVTIVALVRLALGVLVGIVAGWSRRSGARALSGLIDAALALPLLVVALAAITAVGIETGLVAFIIGMCLTGWAETAQTVRAQTQLVATQPYIAAARALGATGAQIVLRHISRHIGPLLATLLAFEISAALMLAAALAFMGYFIGGGVWIITAGELIPNATRVAGPPELGQLIGTAEIRISSQPPWEMIFPSLVIVLAILGFTLLGEGLRRRQMRARPGEGRWLGRLLGAPLGRLEEAMVVRAGGWGDQAARQLYGLAALALVAAFGLLWWRVQPAEQAVAGVAPAPGLAARIGWPAQRGDPYGTLRGAPAASAAPSVTWEFRDERGLGAPAVGPDGSVYVAGGGGTLYALGPDGAPRWEAAVEGEPIGGPAVAPDGTIYVVDRGGGLSAFNEDGGRRWRFVTGYRAEGSSGPIVAPDGTIYYAVVDAVQAVGPDGAGLWLGRDPGLPYQEMLPRVSPDGDLVFLKNAAFTADTGSRLELPIVPDEPRFADSAFLVGADGRTYYRSEHRVLPWRTVDAGIAVQPALTWSASGAFFMPSDVGVTADGTAWLIYSTEFADLRLVWVGADGLQHGDLLYPMRAARAVAANDDGSLEVCGLSGGRLSCAAFVAGADEPLWEVELAGRGVGLVGGALADGRRYIVGSDGTLFALE